MVNLRDVISRAIEGYAKRNLWKIFGYPEQITLEHYWKRYRRDGIGSRVIRAYPDACWKGRPIVQDEAGSSPDPDEDEYSAFTEAWEDLESRLKVVSILHRADRLARVGHFAIVFLGFSGAGQKLDQPASGNPELAYLSVYAEKSVRIETWVTDPLDPRYGMPEIYVVTPTSNEVGRQSKNLGVPFRVHHSRVIHIAENVDEDEVFGEPALRPIWNDLSDLEKVIGSGAETFWLNARGGLSVEANPEAKMSDAIIKDMKQQVEDYENELRRTLAFQGARVTPISLSVADPKPNFEILLQKISGATGIPQRMLTGSERGELASSEDSNSWEARVQERRDDHCGPNIIRPFIERMIETGNLPEPEGNWEAVWPDIGAMSPEKQATVAKMRLEAAGAWANGMTDRIVSLEEARIMIGLDPTSEYDLEEEDEKLDTEGDGFDEDGTPLPPGNPEDEKDPKDPEDE